tara:strand:+ start:1614 stop:2030 length:417 start_codon:yes stop_codon:yes gene_type:complete
MQDKADKYLDDLTKKVFKETSIESPSFNFTDAVMSQVNALSKSHVTVYKPLISKTTWFLILVGFLAITIYALLYGSQTDSISWLSKLDFSFFSNNAVSNTLSSLKLSKTVMYAIVLFGLMFCVQIPFLKHHFNQRLET